MDYIEEGLKRADDSIGEGDLGRRAVLAFLVYMDREYAGDYYLEGALGDLVQAVNGHLR